MANNQIQHQTALQKLNNFMPKQSLSVEHAITQDQIGLLKRLDPQTTKDKIIQLQYYDPKGQNENCKFNQTRDDIVKIEEIIFEYFKLSIKLIQ